MHGIGYTVAGWSEKFRLVTVGKYTQPRTGGTVGGNGVTQGLWSLMAAGTQQAFLAGAGALLLLLSEVHPRAGGLGRNTSTVFPPTPVHLIG